MNSGDLRTKPVKIVPIVVGGLLLPSHALYAKALAQPGTIVKITTRPAAGD
jgi:hypothetical protein